MNEVEAYEHDGMRVKIFYDEDPMNPRTEWDNLGVMVCFHKRYTLGDAGHGYRYSEYESWNEVYRAIQEEEDPLVVLPIFMYDHGGITISVGSGAFEMCDAAGWDWGQVGFIFARKKDVRKEYGKKRISAKTKAQVEDRLRSEVEEYDQYLRGNVYGYEVYDAHGESQDSCWNFFGIEHCRESANEGAEYWADEERRRPPTRVPAPVCAEA